LPGKLLEVLVLQVADDKHEQSLVDQYTIDEAVVKGLWNYTRIDDNEE